MVSNKPGPSARCTVRQQPIVVCTNSSTSFESGLDTLSIRFLLREPSRFRFFVVSLVPSAKRPSLADECVQVHRVPIRLNRPRPIAISAEYCGSGFRVTLEHLRNRMPEMVAASHADDRDVRAKRLQELHAARRQTAVVRHLDDPERGRAD